MRRPLALATIVFLAAAGSACGASSGASHRPIVFGVSGGNMVPYRVTIQPNGAVRATGSMHVKHRQIPMVELRGLRRTIAHAHLASRHCPDALPDVGSQYIRVGDRTVTVHGNCEAGFNRTFRALGRAVGLGLS